MVVIPDFKANTINRFLTQNVASGATIYTDGLKTFTALEERRRQPMAAFQTLLGLGTLHHPTPYKKIRRAKELSESPPLPGAPNPSIGLPETTG